MVRRESPDGMEILGFDEATARGFTLLLRPSEENIHTSTDLTPIEGFSLPTLLSYGKVLKSKTISNWVELFELMRISRLRLGRKEMILALTGLRELAESRKKGKLSDLMG